MNLPQELQKHKETVTIIGKINASQYLEHIVIMYVCWINLQIQRDP